MADHSRIHQRHDTSYRYLLASKQIFVELLHSFVRQGWEREVDESGIEEIPHSFVLSDFKRKEADLVYRVTLNGQPVIFYLLVELQSRVDYMMPYRLLLYMVEVWRYLMKDLTRNFVQRKQYRLPAIIPIVLYNGRRHWTASRSFRGIVANERLFGGQIVDFEYILIDVARYTEEELLSLANTIGSVFLIDQAKDRDQLLGRLQKLMNAVRDMPEAKQQSFVSWIANIVAKQLPAKNRELEELLTTSQAKKGVSVMGLEKVLKDIRKEGKVEGRVEGKIEGREEGFEEGRETVARNMIKLGLDTAIIASATGFTTEKIEAMRQ